jgi:hypothetical protein
LADYLSPETTETTVGNCPRRRSVQLEVSSEKVVLGRVMAGVILAVVGLGLAGCSATHTTAPPHRSAGRQAASFSFACRAGTDPPVLALTPTGEVEALDPATLQVEGTVLTSVLPGGGLALRPELDDVYATAPGPDGEPALWAVPLCGQPGRGAIVEEDAELPSVSPDGGFLGFVTLDAQGHQTGVAVSALNGRGRPVGALRRYAASSTPPPLRVTGVAVGRLDAGLAVWGGFVDSYLGPRQPTVGMLDPATANSLASLVPVFDAQGISGGGPPPGGQKVQKPEAWQSSPVYLPNGELLVGDTSIQISLPYTDTTPGVQGGGIRTIVHSTGPVTSLAAGRDGSLVFVGSDGKLTMAVNAVNLPLGPGADYAPSPPPREYSARGPFTAVAWTEGPAAETAPLPPVFDTVNALPNVVGLSLSVATTTLNDMGLPVVVGTTVVNASMPAGTVLAQSPAPGTEVACQCAVALTVSRTS